MDDPRDWGDLRVCVVGGVSSSLFLGRKLIGISLIVANSPRLLFLITLQRTLRSLKEKGLHHWDEVIPGKLVLSAIPSFTQLPQIVSPTTDGGLGVTAVVVVLSKCELRPSLLYRPVQLSEWKERSIETLHVESGDFFPVTVADLLHAANFIHKKVTR